MTTPIAALHHGSARSTPASKLDAADSRLARSIVGHALLVGIAADLLLRAPTPGIGFPILVAIVALTMASIVWRSGRDVSAEAAGWLAAAVLAACGLGWRESDTLQFVDAVAAVGALGMAAVTLSDAGAGLFATRLRDTLWRAMEVVRSAVAGILPLALREFFATDGRGRWAQGWRPVLRAVLIATALLFVFGSLLRNADPIFASLVSMPAVDAGTIVWHITVIGFYTWVVGGWLRGAVAPRPGARPAPETLPFSLGMLDVTTALGTLNVLFGAFVATQLGWFFGGERFLQARTGLTAAAYAREGFFQMLLVVLLVVPVLLATRAALQPGRALARRHTVLALPVVALLGAIILSAVLRMKLYVHYYGLTTDRFYPLVLMGWLALVLVWLAATVLRGNGRLFVAGALTSAFATLVALNVMNPDVIVARVNLARHERGAELDLSHLAHLSGEASAIATDALLASSTESATPAARATFNRDRCAAANALLERWGPGSEAEVRRATSDAAWRFWNAGEVRAIRVVHENGLRLRELEHATCERPTGVVIRRPPVEATAH